ncbi:MAG: aspartate kinase [Spirochaetales bacterium]|nr:aspartate kinase [Spirochaetales bacterium]
MIVMKFGGTSVQNAEKINNALDIAEKELPLRAVVLVSSAMGKTTDRIIDAFTSAENGRIEKAMGFMEDIKDLHFRTAREFLNDENLSPVTEDLDRLFGQFASLLKGVALLRDCTSRTRDAFLSFGERLSTTLIAARARERGINVQLLDSRDFMITDSNFGSAAVDFPSTNRLIKERIPTGREKLYVAQGFIGGTEEGVTTTLGRGGSDYSASIIGAALEATDIQIWTDVDGIMSSDPRSVEGVKTIPNVTYREAGELAYFGAKVVHPATIQPAVGKSIPVRVLNSGNPSHRGTTISSDAPVNGLKAIANKKKITLINIESTRMLNAYGFLNRIFSVFDKYETSVDLVTTSEVSVSITIEDSSRLEEIKEELKPIGKIQIEEDKSIICLVGQELWKDGDFLSQVFKTCEGVPLRMISLGSSDINLSLVVPQEKTDEIVQRLHDRFLT